MEHTTGVIRCPTPTFSSRNNHFFYFDSIQSWSVIMGKIFDFWFVHMYLPKIPLFASTHSVYLPEKYWACRCIDLGDFFGVSKIQKICKCTIMLQVTWRSDGGRLLKKGKRSFKVILLLRKVTKLEHKTNICFLRIDQAGIPPYLGMTVRCL